MRKAPIYGNRFTMVIPVALRERVRRVADAMHRSEAFVVRKAVTEYLKKPDVLTLHSPSD